MERLGDYEIVRKLGEGGMGSVFLAKNPSGALVVVKTPRHPTPDIVARMEDEARIGFRLRHPHIVRTLDFFTWQERPVLVIEWIDGASLKDLRDTHGRLPPAMVARVGEQISDALATIHHLKDISGQPLNILHRDVTPGNILVDRAGDAKLIDLGIARSVESRAKKTSAGILRGTFRYLSPDLFAGQPYSWMTDLWALGVSLFESALGRRAIEGNDASVFAAVARGKLTALRDGEELHPMLRFLFDGLLAPDPAQRRFKDPEEVLHAFRVLRARLGDGAAEARAVMASVPQGDVSGEFGNEDGVPTTVAGAAPPKEIGAMDTDVTTSVPVIDVCSVPGSAAPPLPAARSVPLIDDDFAEGTLETRVPAPVSMPDPPQPAGRRIEGAPVVTPPPPPAPTAPTKTSAADPARAPRTLPQLPAIAADPPTAASGHDGVGAPTTSTTHHRTTIAPSARGAPSSMEAHPTRRVTGIAEFLASMNGAPMPADRADDDSPAAAPPAPPHATTPRSSLLVDATTTTAVPAEDPLAARPTIVSEVGAMDEAPTEAGDGFDVEIDEVGA